MTISKTYSKRFLIIVLVFVCSLLFVSCSVTTNSNKELANDILASVQENMKKANNDNEQILMVSDELITKEEFIYYCRFYATVLDSTYNYEETINETIRSFALAQEAKQRGIKIPDNENNEIDESTQDYVYDSYGNKYPSTIYKKIGELSYLENELEMQIQEEILSGKISIDDNNTRKVYRKFKSFRYKAEILNKYWSDDRKMDELKKYLYLVNDVKVAYIDNLIATHLSLPKATSNSTAKVYNTLDYFDEVFENISDAKNPKVLAAVNGEKITEIEKNMYLAMEGDFTYTTEELVRRFILADYAKKQGLQIMPVALEKINQLEESLTNSEELTDEYCIQNYGISKKDVINYRVNISYQMWYYHAFFEMLNDQASSGEYPQDYPELRKYYERFQKNKLKDANAFEDLEQKYYEAVSKDYDVVIYEK